MEIKNCPFCDSEAVLKVTEDNSDYCFYKNGNPKLYYDVKCNTFLFSRTPIIEIM